MIWRIDVLEDKSDLLLAIRTMSFTRCVAVSLFQWQCFKGGVHLSTVTCNFQTVNRDWAAAATPSVNSRPD